MNKEINMMTPRDFCYWLQGFFELSNTNILSGDQVNEIRRHLQMVFTNNAELDVDRIMSTIKNYYNETNINKMRNDNDFLDIPMCCPNTFPPASC